MQKLTILHKNEMLARYNKEREKEWEILASKMVSRGLGVSGALGVAFIEVGFKYINRLLDELIKTEKNALLHEKKSFSDDYFIELKEELNKIAEKESDVIKTKSSLKHLDSKGEDIFRFIEHSDSVRESISRRVDKLQEELRLGITRISGDAIYVAGDVGMINTGEVYGSINVKLEKLKESNQKELATAFSDLANTIKYSHISEEDERNQIEALDFLVDQSEIPQEKRKYGIINATERVLSSATNLVTVWDRVRPLILKALGIEIE